MNVITIDKNNRVITSELFPGRVQVFRYVTDAEFEAEKKLREGEGTGAVKEAAAPVQKQPTTPAGSERGRKGFSGEVVRVTNAIQKGEHDE